MGGRMLHFKTKLIMKLIYPNFKNHSPIGSTVLRQLDEYRLEIFDADMIQIDTFEQFGCVALLELTQFCDFPHKVLVHSEYDNVQDFVETNNEFKFYTNGHDYTVPKHAEPIFYNLIQ